MAEEIDEGPERRTHLAPRGIVDIETFEGRAPVVQHAQKPPFPYVFLDTLFEDEGKTGAIERRLADKALVRDQQRTIDIHHKCLAVLFQFPPVDQPAGKAAANAAMMDEIARMLRHRMACEISRRADHGAAPLRTGADCDHVLFQMFTEAQARIEPLGNDILEAIIRVDVERDIRIAVEE